jgi:translocation and assembly module TamA
MSAGKKVCARRGRRAWMLLFVWYAISTPAPADIDVDIEGVGNSLEEEIEGSLAIYQERNSDALTEARVRLLHRRGTEEIRRLLEAHGYYRSEVDAELTRAEQDWRARYRVTLNEPIRVRSASIQVTGSEDREVLERARQFPLEAGDRFDHGRYEGGKAALLRQALRKGYLDARYTTHEVRIELEANAADISLSLAPGERYDYGEIRFSDTPLDAALLSNLVPFKAGQPYDADQLLDFQRVLQDTDYFSAVEILPGRSEPADHRVPIDIKLTMSPRNRYRAGAGFGTDSGPRITLGWDNRYINRRGHRLTAELTGSMRNGALGTAYTLPFFRRTDARLSFTASVEHEDTDTSVSDTFKTGVQHAAKRWGWDETLSLNYLFEDFAVGTDDETSRLLIPGVSWARSRGDDPVYPRKGYRLSVAFQGAHDAFISAVSFAQVRIRGKAVLPLGNKGRLITRADFGATATGSFGELPASLRFFAGGDQSIRGFDFEALGPRDADGEVAGGRYLAVGSVEVERRIKGNWGAAVFADFGNAFNNVEADPAIGVGAGARWLSPVGMVRLDLAYGHSSHDNGIRLHIVLGPDL